MAKTLAFNTNVLILGKTGAGKSSLLNYLYRQQLTVGKAGRPQTAKGLHKQPPFDYKGLQITIYDSWGLEADKTEIWRKLLEEELHRNETESIKDWFHTVIYCFDAKASRLDMFEREEIIDRLLNRGVRLIFALTKWDLCSEAERQAACRVIKEAWPQLDYVPVCSVSKTLRNGTKTEPCGREHLFKTMCINLRDNLVYKTLNHAETRFRQALTDAEQDILSYFDEQAGSLGIFTYYGEDLIEKLKTYGSSSYERHVSAVLNQLRGNFQYIDSFCAQVIEAYTNRKIKVPSFAELHSEELFFDGFIGWDNSWAEDLATVLTSVLLPFFQFFKKDLYKDKVKATLKVISEQLKVDFEQYLNGIRVNEQKITERYQICFTSGELQ